MPSDLIELSIVYFNPSCVIVKPNFGDLERLQGADNKDHYEKNKADPEGSRKADHYRFQIIVHCSFKLFKIIFISQIMKNVKMLSKGFIVPALSKVLFKNAPIRIKLIILTTGPSIKLCKCLILNFSKFEFLPFSSVVILSKLFSLHFLLFPFVH